MNRVGLASSTDHGARCSGPGPGPAMRHIRPRLAPRIHKPAPRGRRSCSGWRTDAPGSSTRPLRLPSLRVPPGAASLSPPCVVRGGISSPPARRLRDRAQLLRSALRRPRSEPAARGLSMRARSPTTAITAPISACRPGGAAAGVDVVAAARGRVLRIRDGVEDISVRELGRQRSRTANAATGVVVGA